MTEPEIIAKMATMVVHQTSQVIPDAKVLRQVFELALVGLSRHDQVSLDKAVADFRETWSRATVQVREVPKTNPIIVSGSDSGGGKFNPEKARGVLRRLPLGRLKV